MHADRQPLLCRVRWVGMACNSSGGVVVGFGGGSRPVLGKNGD